MTVTRSIQMTFCRVDYGPDWALTVFPDGTQYGAMAHDTPEYRTLAERCGYRTLRPHDDINRYMIEHEIAHSFIAQELYGGTSRVLWALAHGRVASKLDILHEESLAIDLQAFTRAGVLPGSSAPKFSWFALRDKFIVLCDAA